MVNFIIVKLLISSGANIESRDSLGCTPLFIAAMNNHYDIFNYLLSCGENLEYFSNRGLTSRNAVTNILPSIFTDFWRNK